MVATKRPRLTGLGQRDASAFEGSEAEVFSSNADRWIDRVRNICIELHGKQCEQTFLEAMRNHTFDRAMSGEYLVCTNIRRRS